MTAKDYLSQAKYLDARINSKIQQVQALNDLATKCTSTMSGMPHNPSKSVSSMADIIGKIIDLQDQINCDIDALVDLKKEIMTVIKEMNNPEYQTVLERRYLCFEQWEKIAADMGYDLRWLFRLHGKALDSVQSILDKSMDAERNSP